MDLTIEIKKRLYDLCVRQIEDKINTYQASMQAAQASANEESKSSAGDKYETGRAMMQIERDKYAVQLAENLKLKQVLDNIDPNQPKDKAVLGSVLHTSQGYFFISISLGKLVLDGKTFFAVSPSSPIGKVMFNKAKGEDFQFNQRLFKVVDLI